MRYPPILVRVIAAAAVALLLSAQEAAAQKLLAEGIKDLAAQIAAKVSQHQKHRIAVLPFKELEGQPTVLGSYLSESLVTALFDSPGLDIVERTMLDKIIGELRLDQSGLIDPLTAKRVGKIAGVDAIVTGTITDLASYVSVNCRLIDALTGRIFAAAETRIAKDDDVRKIMGASAAGPDRGASGSLQTRQHVAASKSRLQREENGFVFDLRRCAIGGSTVTCDLLITNRGDDRHLWLRFLPGDPSNSRLIDESGREYLSRDGILGSSHNQNPTSLLVSGIPLRAQVSFEKVSPDVQEAKLIEIGCYEGKNGAFVVQFRDVPLARP